MVNQVAIGKVSIVGPMLPIDKIWLCCEFYYALFFFPQASSLLSRIACRNFNIWNVGSLFSLDNDVGSPLMCSEPPVHQQFS